MKSRVRLLGHSVHQMLIVFPLGLLATSVIFDVLGVLLDQAGWWSLSYWVMASGIVGALIAAPFGLIDWLAIPRGTRARRVGALHGLGNGLVSLLFVGSWLLRSSGAYPGSAAMALSFAGIALALVTGWLGGELVARLGVGVDDDAELNAPNSLTHRVAHRNVM
jgi:uncharacterized membrane protein